MIDRRNETLLTLQDAAAELPAPDGKPVHWRTLYGWWWKGLRGVCLETILIANRRFTSREALDRFLEAINAARQPRHAEPRIQEPMPRVCAATRATLARHGIEI